MVRTVLASILKEGRAVRPWLGASGKTVTADLAKSLALPRPSGVLVDRVIAASPADKAGLAVGDIVRTVNGHEIQDVEEFRYLLATLAVNTKASLGTLHKGAERLLTVSLLAPPESPPRKKTTLGGREPFAGAAIANFNPALAGRIGQGISRSRWSLCSRVSRNSVAAGVGLKPGDVITAVGDKTVASVDDMVKLVSQPANRWSFTICPER